MMTRGIVIIDGGSMVIKDVNDDDDDANTIVTGDGHYNVTIEGQFGSVERIVIERES